MAQSFWEGQTFMWRSCTNSLPVKLNLLKRKICGNSRCHLCDKGEESVIHALWECDKFRQVWDKRFRWGRNWHWACS